MLSMSVMEVGSPEVSHLPSDVLVSLPSVAAMGSPEARLESTGSDSDTPLYEKLYGRPTSHAGPNLNNRISSTQQTHPSSDGFVEQAADVSPVQNRSTAPTVHSHEDQFESLGRSESRALKRAARSASLETLTTAPPKKKARNAVRPTQPTELDAWTKSALDKPICKACYANGRTCIAKNGSRKCTSCQIDSRECIWPSGSDALKLVDREVPNVSQGSLSKLSLNIPVDAGGGVVRRKKRSGRKGSSTYKFSGKRSHHEYPAIDLEWSEDRNTPVDIQEAIERHSIIAPWAHVVQRHELLPSPNSVVSDDLVSREDRLDPPPRPPPPIKIELERVENYPMPSLPEFMKNGSTAASPAPAFVPHYIIQKSALMRKRLQERLYRMGGPQPSKYEMSEDMHTYKVQLLSFLFKNWIQIATEYTARRPLVISPGQEVPPLSRGSTYFDLDGHQSTPGIITPEEQGMQLPQAGALVGKLDVASGPKIALGEVLGIPLVESPQVMTAEECGGLEHTHSTMEGDSDLDRGYDSYSGHPASRNPRGVDSVREKLGNRDIQKWFVSQRQEIAGPLEVALSSQRLSARVPFVRRHSDNHLA